MGSRAKVSCGPSSCLESTRQVGGQTGYLKTLCKENVLFQKFNFRTLECKTLYTREGPFVPLEDLEFDQFKEILPKTAVSFLSKEERILTKLELYQSRYTGMEVFYQERPAGIIKSQKPTFQLPEGRYFTGRPVRSAEDLLNWAIQTALNDPIRVRSVRTHTVSEPSKARVITVPSYAYTVIMYVFSHLWQRTLQGQHVRSGLQSSRHLWNLMWRDLHPQNNLWEKLDTNQTIYGLSTDWSEATDHGNPTIARQIWHALIQKSKPNIGFPLGLAMLAKTLYCGKRYVFSRLRSKPVIKSRAWFMGDPMTKVILTIINDYVHYIARPAVSSGVGDDVVALDNSKDKLTNYLHEMEKVEMKISWDDTYISSYFIFYCEEASLIPKKPSHTPIVCVRRGIDHICYIDYPRIRLLLPVKPELDRWSYTNLGRTSLLGKEVRWSLQTNYSLSPRMIMAGLLQQLLLAKEVQTLCPYIPEQIGGDGAHHPDPEFVTQVIKRKSKNYLETLTRMSQLIQNTFGFKFIRTERTNQVTHKYHHWLPKFRELQTLIPESAIIRPVSDEHRALIGSLRSHEIETPEQTMLRLLKNYFYRAVLRGEDPQELTLDRDQIYGRGKPPKDWLVETQVWVKRFLRHWRRPGFKFRNQYEYFVNSSQVNQIDYLNLGWHFNPDWRIDKETLKEEWDTYIQSSLDLIRDEDAVRAIICGDHPTLPDRIRDRLNLFMESDNLILWEFSKVSPVPDTIVLVSADRKLAAEILRLARRTNKEAIVLLVLPIVWLLGRSEEIKGTFGIKYELSDAHIIRDPGAEMHTDLVYFEDGMVDDIYFFNEVKCLPTKWYPGVFTVFIQGDDKPVDITDWTSQEIESWLKEY
jgi:hypothetical protein